MGNGTQVFLELLADDVAYYGRQFAQRVRSQLPPDVVRAMTPEQHRGLEAAMKDQLKSVVWSFLGHFDNVGCHLPEGVFGYSIVERFPESDQRSVGDIRIEEADYADMWLDFMLQQLETSNKSKSNEVT